MPLAPFPTALRAGVPSSVPTFFHHPLANANSVPDDTLRSFKAHTDAITTYVQH